MKKTRSLELWSQYGSFILMATPYKDEVIAEARDCTLVDVDGNEYLDFVSGQFCTPCGNSHPELVARLTEQLPKVVHISTSHLSEEVMKASARLASITPGELNKSLLLSTGAEAIEYALRIARAYTGNSGVLCLDRGYAGLTLQTASLSNGGLDAVPLIPGTGYLTTPDPTQCPPGISPAQWALELLKTSLDRNRSMLDDVAAIVFEPILSAGGMIVLPDEYIKALRDLADDLGALLVADEAQTGLGRTGHWFGVEHSGVVPDILVLAKGLGGGIPVSAVCTTPKIADRVMSEVNQFSSHQSDPLGAVASLAVIEIIENEGLVARAREVGAYFFDQLYDLSRRCPQLINVRGRGLMLGFDVIPDPNHPVSDYRVGTAVRNYCRQEGVMVQFVKGNRFRVLPPLTIQESQIDQFCKVLERALERIVEGPVRTKADENIYTVAFHGEELGFLRRTLRWIWIHSPKQWIERMSKSIARKIAKR
jgi:2,2-dialkylglycine decarboxylase (pyruvate)